MLVKKLLLAYDGTEGAQKALEKAVEFAKANPELRVCVLHVAEPPRVLAGDGYMAMKGQIQTLSEVDKESEVKLEQAERALSAYVNCTTELKMDGDPGRAIVEHAERNDYDLIVVGSRGLSGIKKFFLGSVSGHVVQNASVPVLVVK